MVVKMWIMLFLFQTLTKCSLTDGNQHFGGMYHLHLWDRSEAIALSPEDGGDNFLQNVGIHLQDYMVPQPGRPQSTIIQHSVK
jgi:hypothetical protein